jgi:ubiquinone/menaquinone biosynthesis C-methylase UbiE
MTSAQRYPALLLDSLTPVYDLFARLFLPELQIKRDLISHARIGPSQRVLDLGAGSGTLAILIKQIQPGAQVTGIDGDPHILQLAREKAVRSDVDIAFDLGNAVALPYSDLSFDRVLSALVMSVLSRQEKQLAIREAYRLLIGGGELHLADFGPPRTF